MERPEKLLSKDLRRTVGHFTTEEVARLLDQLNGYLPRLWESMEELEPTEHEADFENAEPPKKYRLTLPRGGDLGEGLIEQIEAIPLRWRSDVALAALQYVILEKVPYDE